MFNPVRYVSSWLDSKPIDATFFKVATWIPIACNCVESWKAHLLYQELIAARNQGIATTNLGLAPDYREIGARVSNLAEFLKNSVERPNFYCRLCVRVFLAVAPVIYPYPYAATGLQIATWLAMTGQAFYFEYLAKHCSRSPSEGAPLLSRDPEVQRPSYS